MELNKNGNNQVDELKLHRPSLVIITGLSGAGKSTAMRVFDDLGYYCLDNLPPALILDFYHLYLKGSTHKAGVAIASDMRSGALFDDFQNAVKRLEDESIHFALLYLDCDTDVLMNRFKEVRRAHPLETRYSLRDAISEERTRLESTLALATHVIDSTHINVAQLRQVVLKTVLQQENKRVSQVKVVSFGFKYGVPRDADYVFDVRFLPNPFYLEALRPLSGEDGDVYNYVMNHKAAEQFFMGIVQLLDPTFDAFIDVGKFSVNIAVGCTGGRHRSVAFAKRLAAYYEGQNRLVQTYHRDLVHPL
ncbi:MAG: RNase adapter RapZ [Deltaproteobacteria bacterium]|nr:RNase adapter RapZ [Deltaproteobacteria bacterium]